MITTSLVEVVAVIRESQHLLDLCVLGWTFPDRMNAPPSSGVLGRVKDVELPFPEGDR
jgi:hypothetical protein